MEKGSETLVTNKNRDALRASEPPRPQAKTVFETGICFVDLVHEIRNPLNGMDTTLQLMGRHLVKVNAYEDPVMLSYVEDLRKEIQRIHNTLLDIQTFWRDDIQPAPIEIRDLIAEVLKTAPLNHEVQGIHVKIALPEDLPRVRAHDKLLQRALSNLIKNAVEAMPGGGDLTLRAYAHNSSVVVEVIDTGVGIPRDLEVFDAFTTSKPGGMGLGLSIVQRIVSALDGELVYSSQPGNGTTFRLALPQWKKDAARRGGNANSRTKPEDQ
jgi:signal transduction histidine kinase